MELLQLLFITWASRAPVRTRGMQVLHCRWHGGLRSSKYLYTSAKQRKRLYRAAAEKLVPQCQQMAPWTRLYQYKTTAFSATRNTMRTQYAPATTSMKPVIRGPVW